MRFYLSSRTRLGLALGWSSITSLALFVVGIFSNDSTEFSYLIWNLALAWIPLALTLWLERTLRRKLWSSWQALALTLLWVAFLPNSFYMITDFIHLKEVARADILFDVITFTSFVANGVVLGFASLYMVHSELAQRVGRQISGALVSGTLLLTSFAIYIGRDLRWNTWDIVFNPASLLFDVSDRLLNPGTHPQVISTTFGFFVLLGSLYFIMWQLARNLRQRNTT